MMGMDSESLAQNRQNVEYHLVTLFEKLDAVRREAMSSATPQRISMHAEIRTLEFWRCVISECLAAFFYVYVVCGTAAGASGTSSNSAPLLSVTLNVALASGFTMATLTQCFGHISGAHVNPAVTVAMVMTKNTTPLRALMFITAQCGGSIAGAALTYSMMIPGNMGNLNIAVSHFPDHLNAWERFGVEFILTFIIVLAYFVSKDIYHKWLGSSALTIGSAYLACTLVSTPSLNPVRTLGPAFVLNRWDNHWVYWLGPIAGGIVSGLIYEFILNPGRNTRQMKESVDGESSSIHSDEDPYDELEKPPASKSHSSTYNTSRIDTYRPPMNPNGTQTSTSPAGPGNAYCPSLISASLYSVPPCNLDRVESLYGGTKSLCAKSPPLTRANLNRSQSVYGKVPAGPICNRDGLPHPGPLVPAQSLYPMRFNQSQNITNQKVQNQQLLQPAGSVYGVHAVANINHCDTGGVYGISLVTSGNTTSAKLGAGSSHSESAYGTVVNCFQDSDDLSYGSYVDGTSNGRAGNVNKCGIPQPPIFNSPRNDMHKSPKAHKPLLPSPSSVINTMQNVASYHHNQHTSPNLQY